MNKQRTKNQILNLKSKRNSLQYRLEGLQSNLDTNKALLDRATQEESDVTLGQAERALRTLYKTEFQSKREDITRRINKIKQDLRSLNYQIETLEQYLQS